MSIPFFNDVLMQIGKKLNFESISHLYGNSFAKNADKYINEANPLIKKSASGAGGFAAILNKSTITKQATPEATKKAAIEKLGDVSWADGLFD